MRFIRKNGRVIPIRERAQRGIEKAVIPAAVVTGGVYSAVETYALDRVLPNPHSAVFWGHKGALVGAAAGAAGAMLINKGVKSSPETQSRMKKAFVQSAVVGSAAQAFRVARPFFSKNKKVKAGVFAAEVVGSTLMPFVPLYHALKAPKGERGRVLAAGALGAVGGTNLGKLGDPLFKHRSRLGLKRFNL